LYLGCVVRGVYWVGGFLLVTTIIMVVWVFFGDWAWFVMARLVVFGMVVFVVVGVVYLLSV